MAASVTRTFGVSQSTQRLIWSYGNGVTVKAHCWGGGGGGGGNDSGRGGSGAGGGYGYSEFTVNNGDVIDVAVGAAGGAGSTGSTGTGGGSPGGGYMLQEIFNTRNNIPSGWTTPSNPSWTQFLNSYAIWPDNYSVEIDYTWSITVSGGNFVIQTGFDCPRRIYNYVYRYTPRLIVSVDGVDIFGTIPATNYFDYGFNNYIRINSGIEQTMIYNITLSAGTHTVRVRSAADNVIDQLGAGGFGMRIGAAQGSFGGGRGGNAGSSGFSGAGGGGGGATTVYLNSTLIACGGGGGGGGGGGNGPTGDNAPGTRGQAVPGLDAGENGYNKYTDGGGGGGGGGGYGGGQGGECPGGDIGGQAGSNGGNFGLITESSTAQAPAGSASEFYNQSWGRGGAATISGNGGACVLQFFVSGVNVKTAQGWEPVKTTWLRVDDAWRPMQAGWIKVANAWEYFINSFAPLFTADPLTWGVNSRLAPDSPPPEPTVSYSDSGGSGYYGDYSADNGTPGESDQG